MPCARQLGSHTADGLSPVIHLVLLLILQLHFTPDAQEKDLEIFHRLKLYADDDPTGQNKKPVTSVRIALGTPAVQDHSSCCCS